MKQKLHKPRICFILESFYPVVNGASIQILLLGNRLSELGSQTMVITRRTNVEDRYYENIRGIDVFRVKPAVGLKRIGKYLMIIPAFFKLAKERTKYDLIIVCDLKVLGILGVIAAKILGKKSLVRAESCGEMDGSFATQFAPPPSVLKSLSIKILVFLRNTVLKRSDGFLSISSKLTREFLEQGVRPRAIFEITNGVDVSLFAPLDSRKKMLLKHKLGLSKKKYFVYTGRLGRGKGLGYLLLVWKKLVAEFEDIHLILVGSGEGYALSCENELKDYAVKNALTPTVTFTGSVNNVNEYLQASDFFVFPSQSEGLGLSLIEALGCGLPSIATSVGGILDIIKDNSNGILVPYGDEDKLFEAMKEVLENGEKANRLGREGRITVLERFNINRIVDTYLSLFRKLQKSKEDFTC